MSTMVRCSKPLYAGDKKYIVTVYSIYVKLNTNQKTERFFIYYHNKITIKRRPFFKAALIEISYNS